MALFARGVWSKIVQKMIDAQKKGVAKSYVAAPPGVYISKRR